MLTVSPGVTARLSVSVRVLSVALKAPMAVTLSGWLPEPTTSSKALFDTPVVTRLPARSKRSTNWLPLTVAPAHTGGVLLVTAWLWKLLASLPTESWITRPESPSPAASLYLTVAVPPLFTARDSVSVTVLSAFARTLLTVMAALPAVALATEKPGLPVMAVRSRSLLALKATTNWLPLTVAPLTVTDGSSGVLLVTVWTSKLVASVPFLSWITVRAGADPERPQLASSHPT